MDGKRPTVSSLHGMVAAAHPLAAQAGARLLADGGNAFDAAAATAAALNVVEPYMSGLAGMGMATCYVAAERRVRTLDYVTRVPSRFSTERFRTRADLARGPLATGTPGNLAGWCELVRAHGRKPLAEVLAPAIRLAADGFPLIEFNVAGDQRGRRRAARASPHSARTGRATTPAAPADARTARSCASPISRAPSRASPPKGPDTCMAARSASGSSHTCRSSAACSRSTI